MKLGVLMQDLVAIDPRWADLEVLGVEEDSRRVRPGYLFVALQGLHVDGQAFAAGAVAAGACAVIASQPIAGLGAPCLVVENPARALALTTARLFGTPATALELIGVTGTNGKTTTTYLIEAILRAAGHRPGVIGTVGYRYADVSEQAPFTTPTPGVLHGTFRRMVDADCTHAVMEVSSHALQLGRLWGCSFSTAAFTNLTQDHLDLHGSMEAYLAAKLLLFTRHLRSAGKAVINLDGAGAGAVVDAVHRRSDLVLLRCSSSDPTADVHLIRAAHTMDGMTALLRCGGAELEIRSRLVGAYNVENLLLAVGSAIAAGVPLATIAVGIASLQGVPGRLERVNAGGEFAVLVDYAHTPDALMRAMAVVRPLCRGRLIVVFGCGGDRDRGKRPLMGAAVARQADLAVVTSDNPRSEDPLAIIEAILQGVRGEAIPHLANLASERGYLVQPDRRQAIALAVDAARPGDIVLIAGKGHEDYQILGKQRIHFDDREEARKALAER